MLRRDGLEVVCMLAAQLQSGGFTGLGQPELSSSTVEPSTEGLRWQNPKGNL